MSPYWYAVLGLAVALSTVANVLLRVGMQRVGKPPTMLGTIRKAIREPRVWLGVLFMAGFFGCYAYTLTRVPVSLANPVTALNIILASAYAAWRLHEHVTPRRWLGVALVTLGVVLVTLA